jgi:hypothetical protein
MFESDLRFEEFVIITAQLDIRCNVLRLVLHDK